MSNNEESEMLKRVKIKLGVPSYKPLGFYGIIQCVCGKMCSVENPCHEYKTFQSKLNADTNGNSTNMATTV